MLTANRRFKTAKFLVKLFALCAVVSCNTASKSKSNVSKIDTINITSVVDSYPQNSLKFLGSGEQLGNQQPFDSIVPPNSHWKGIFLNKEHCWYIKDVKVSATKIPDSTFSIYDIVVKKDNPDQDILMVSGPAGLVDGLVEADEKAIDYMVPGNDVKFTYKQHTYLLHATGKVIKTDDRKPLTYDNISNVHNYNLYIRGVAKGHYFNQLLVHNDSYEGGFFTAVNFAGDLDGDNIPDFIINDNSYGFGYAATLFLSKAAGPNRLLICVGGTATND